MGESMKTKWTLNILAAGFLLLAGCGKSNNQGAPVVSAPADANNPNGTAAPAGQSGQSGNNGTMAGQNQTAGQAPAAPEDRFARMFELLTGDALWAKDYDKFVHDKSFAGANEVISFTAALEATRRLVEIYGRRHG